MNDKMCLFGGFLFKYNPTVEKNKEKQMQPK